MSYYIFYAKISKLIHQEKCPFMFYSIFVTIVIIYGIYTKIVLQKPIILLRVTQANILRTLKFAQ